MKIAVVRIRGVRGVHPDITKSLDTLCLRAINQCVLVDDTPSLRGLVATVKDYVAYGAVSEKTIASLITERGEFGNKKATEVLKASQIDSLAKEIASGPAKKSDSKDNLNKVFRLHPPRKGYGGTIKRVAIRGGSLGKRDDMDELIAKML